MQHADAALLRSAVAPATAVAVLVVAGTPVFRGLNGFVAALGGAVLVFLFFGASLLVAKVTRDSHPLAALNLAILSYTLKITLLAVALVLLKRIDAFDAPACAVAVLSTGTAWLAGEVRGYLKLKQPYVEPGGVS